MKRSCISSGPWIVHTLFIVVEESKGAVGTLDLDRIDQLIAPLPGLSAGLIMTPSASGHTHIFSADGPGPALALQLDFPEARARDDAMAAGSDLTVLAGTLTSLAGARISHQPMTGRDFPVLDPATSATPCTFLVEYGGHTDDLQGWLDHYDANHPPIMVRFPLVRTVATFRPLERWTSELPFARGTAMQRNKVVFDSVDALAAALLSPVMDEMKADTSGFPPFSKRATHHAMDTRFVAAAR